jgi:hypothetical protein
MYTLKEWQQVEKDPSTYIVQASTIAEPDGWQHFPIGMSWNIKKTTNLVNRSLNRNTVLCSIKVDTDKQRRPHTKNRESILYNLKLNCIHNRYVNPENYYEELTQTKFVISPEGNGIDCHRHYEALMAGAIPIIEKNTLIQEKYRDLPVLYTNDYSEITIDYLNSIYDTMINRKYNFSRLFLTYYDEETQKEIKQCGNYWMKFLTKKDWYEL